MVRTVRLPDARAGAIMAAPNSGKDGGGTDPDPLPDPGPDVRWSPSGQDGRRATGCPVGPRAACVPVPLRGARAATPRRMTSPSRRSPRLHRKRATEEPGVRGQARPASPRFRFPDVWALKTVPGPRPAPETQRLGEPSGPTVGDDVTSAPETPREEAASGAGRLVGSVMSLYDECCSALWAALPDRPRAGDPEDEDEEGRAGASDEKRVTCESMKETPRR